MNSVLLLMLLLIWLGSLRKRSARSVSSEWSTHNLLNLPNDSTSRRANGHIIFDRDVYGAGDYGDYGISLSSGRITFGMNNGSSGVTLCGTAITDLSGAAGGPSDGTMNVGGNPAGPVRVNDSPF